MIYWLDSFMALFGYKRPEVWEAERREHDVTFPAPQAFKEPRKRANEDVIPKEALAKLKSLGVDMSVVSNTSLSFSDRMKELSKASVRSKKAEKRSQSAEGSANVRSKPLTLSELRKDSGKCHAIYQMVDAFTDEQIAKEIGATVRAVQDYRLLVGWRRR